MHDYLCHILNRSDEMNVSLLVFWDDLKILLWFYHLWIIQIAANYFGKTINLSVTLGSGRCYHFVCVVQQQWACHHRWTCYYKDWKYTILVKFPLLYLRLKISILMWVADMKSRGRANWMLCFFRQDMLPPPQVTSVGSGKSLEE